MLCLLIDRGIHAIRFVALQFLSCIFEASSCESH
jgi:hypothetical protein